MKYLEKFFILMFQLAILYLSIILFGYFCRGVHNLFMIGWNG